jgi:hypothetical protein
MAKLETAAMTDGGLTKMGLSVRMVACAGQPTSFSDITARALTSPVTLAGGDFTLAAGDVSGRKSTVGAKPTISIATSGTADHVVIHDNVSEYIVTTCTSQALTAGGTVSFPAWKKEIAAPV